MWRALISKTASAVTTPPASPISKDEFAAAMERFKPFPVARRFALAISGGPDSMALAFCAKQWADAQQSELRAFIVDHALRDAAADEAKATQTQLTKLGIRAEILRWEHPPIIARLHITARKARYRLLLDACKRYDIHDLLLAHQLEDQAETILMRLAKGSGIDGLAGIAAESKMENIRLLRPFLKVPKERLIATCQSAQLSFVRDPSNQSDKFARGRLRRIMPLLADEGFTIERLADLGERASDAKEALDHYTHVLLRVGMKQDEAGVIRIDLEQFRSAPKAIAERALATCLQTVHAEDYAPERASLMMLGDALRTDDDMPSRTLHGCLISKTRSQALIIREAATITDSTTIRRGENVIWDGRWSVTLNNTAPEHSYVIRALGNPPHDQLDRLAPGLRQHVQQGRARASLPALWTDKNLSLIPSLTPDPSISATAQLLTVWPPISPVV